MTFFLIYKSGCMVEGTSEIKQGSGFIDLFCLWFISSSGSSVLDVWCPSEAMSDVFLGWLCQGTWNRLAGVFKFQVGAFKDCFQLFIEHFIWNACFRSWGFWRLSWWCLCGWSWCWWWLMLSRAIIMGLIYTMYFFK